MNIRSIRFALLIGVITLAILSCSLLTPGITEETPRVPAISMPTPAGIPLPTLAVPEILTNEEALLIDLYRRVNPSVVSIVTYSQQNRMLMTSGQGSGFVYDQNGYILTNSHVVHGADALEVVFSDNTVRNAELVGEDLHSDLAVIKVENLPEGVLPLPLGNMEEVAVGQTVVAIGNPFGLGGTLTRGIVSALGRSIPALTAFSIPQSIQTDAPINPGNSGGPLLNLKGEVIGINAQIETSGNSRVNSGVGFAIPVSIVRRVVPDLISKGKYEWSWLGVRGGNLSPALVKAMNLPVERGAYISEVVSGGPSARAGLRGSTGQVTIDGRIVETGGDVVIAIDGTPVTSFDDMLIYIALKGEPGMTVTLTIIRNGKQQDIEITLDARPTETSTFFNP